MAASAQQQLAILIAGPTASGKSALALRLASALAGRRGCTIVNADSMQVYRDLRLITARPSEAEEAAVPHALYGHVDGAENYSVGRFLADARLALDAIGRDGRVAVIVGGTGLYCKALTDGLSAIPTVPDAIRAAVRAAAEARATPLVHADLAARDPETAAGIGPTDRLRILRALEVLAATGKPLASFRGRRTAGPLAAGTPGVALAARLFLAPERDDLYRRIDARFRAMLASGGLDEVEALARRGLDPALPVMRAHGVPGLIRHLRGELSLEVAIAQAQADTRHYAKRQFTWFRHQMAGWAWVDPDAAEAAALAALEQAMR